MHSLDCHEEINLKNWKHCLCTLNCSNQDCVINRPGQRLWSRKVVGNAKLPLNLLKDVHDGLSIFVRHHGTFCVTCVTGGGLEKHQFD